MPEEIKKVRKSSQSSPGSSHRRSKSGLHRKSRAYKELKRGQQFLTAGVLISLFFYLGTLFNVQRVPVVSDVYRFMFLPVLISLFVLPIVCMLLLMKKKFDFFSYYFYTFCVCLVAIIFVAIVSR